MRVLMAVTYPVLLLAVGYDLRSRRIPNWLTGSAIVGGLLLQCWLRRGSGLVDSLLGLVFGLALLLPLFALGKFGGGDLKLLAAVGALRGFRFVWRAALLGALSGGALALAILALHRELVVATYGLATNSYRSQRTYPYSPAIALGVLLVDLGWLL